jgi:hypothetical protein
LIWWLKPGVIGRSGGVRRRLKADIEVPINEWLSEWNLSPSERPITRPFCSVHWADGAERQILPGDKVLKRETRSEYEAIVSYAIERKGQIVAYADQVLWKIAPNETQSS